MYGRPETYPVISTYECDQSTWTKWSTKKPLAGVKTFETEKHLIWQNKLASTVKVLPFHAQNTLNFSSNFSIKQIIIYNI